MISTFRWLGIVLLAMLLMAGGCGKKSVKSVPPSDPRIVGVWTLHGGDYSLTDEYFADGTFVQHVMGKTTEPKPYRIDGKFLIYAIEQPDGKISEQKEEFVLSDETLTFIDSPKSKRVFRRGK